jgi:thioredoxin 2
MFDPTTGTGPGSTQGTAGTATPNPSVSSPGSAKARPHTVVVRCATCSILNRVDLSRLGDKPKCSRCANALTLDKPLVATDGDFHRFISGATVPVVVDFHADWCGPCKAMAPVLDAFARQQAGHVLVLKVDTDANPVTSQHFRIASIPTLVVFRNGQEWRRQVGAVNRDALDRLVRE